MTFKKSWPNEAGPMLAVNYDDVEVFGWPMMGQPKLNGVRACWDGEHLISRQKKVWKPETLPHIYEKLIAFTASNPGIILDGELYVHGMLFQDIEAVTSPNRIKAHSDASRLDYHAFDTISRDHTEARQITLSQIYEPWVSVCKIHSPYEAEVWLHRFVEAGFEGMMLRQYGCPYLGNRTEALIKMKPWKYTKGKVVDFVEGLGKYQGMLGALVIKLESGQLVKASGGLTDMLRHRMWQRKPFYSLIPVVIKYRELSRNGVPLQPQIVRFE